jgi:tRNA(Ile)-lysidine synthase
MTPRSKNGRYVRPFLGVTRAEIEAYLRRKGLAFRHDRSNDDTGYLRNSIRHELLPFLQRYNPEIAARLADTATILAADEELLDRVTAEAFALHGAAAAGSATLSVPGVRKEPVGLRMRLYRRALQFITPRLAGIAYRHLEAIDSLVISDAPNAELHLPGRCRVVRGYDEMVFQPHSQHEEVPFAVELDGPGSYPLPCGGCLVVAPVDPGTPEAVAAEHACRAVFDLAVAPFPWLVRSFVPGDRLRPAGMAGTKKVKELFMERKIPRQHRHRVPLLFRGERLLWVCGLRRSAYAPANSRTRSPVAVEFIDAAP